MAEIPVERKTSKAWLWVLLGLIVLALLIWWATDDDDAELAAGPADTELTAADGALTDAETMPEGGASAEPGPADTGAGLSLGAILANPGSHIGRDDFEAELSTPEVPTDRGFWVEQDGERMFAIIIDQPREVPLDINSGQQLRITDGMIRDAGFLQDLPGAPLDAATRRIAEAQDAFLVVDESNIEIMSRPAQ